MTVLQEKKINVELSLLNCDIISSTHHGSCFEHNRIVPTQIVHKEIIYFGIHITTHRSCQSHVVEKKIFSAAIACVGGVQLYAHTFFFFFWLTTLVRLVVAFYICT